MSIDRIEKLPEPSDRTWYVNLLRRQNEAMFFEYAPGWRLLRDVPMEPVERPNPPITDPRALAMAETVRQVLEEGDNIVLKEVYVLEYFVYPDTWLADLLVDVIAATALIWGVTSCILGML